MVVVVVLVVVVVIVVAAGCLWQLTAAEGTCAAAGAKKGVKGVRGPQPKSQCC